MINQAASNLLELGSIYLATDENITNTTEAAGTSHHLHENNSADIIFFIFSSLCLGGIIKEVNKKTAVIHL